MTWRYWLGFFAAFAALKWIMGRYGEDAGAYVVVALLVAVLVIAYLLHAHRQHTELTIAQAVPEERAQLLAGLAPGRAAAIRFAMRSFEDIDLSTVPPNAEFAYPPASRRLSAALFWASALCAAGLLLPILRGRVSDLAAGIGLLVTAVLFIVAALGYQRGNRWAGVKVRVDSEGLTEETPSGATTHLPWVQLANVRFRRWAGSLEYEGITGERIRVATTLIDFAHFAELTLVHRYRTSMRGAA
jgi:Bacterial PH domain